MHFAGTVISAFIKSPTLFHRARQGDDAVPYMLYGDAAISNATINARRIR